MKKFKKISKVIIVMMIVAALAVPFSVFGAQLTRGSDFWYNVGYVKAETFTIDGNTAYCVEPGAAVPSNGNYTPTQINNVSLLKVLYYGYGGFGFNNTTKAKMNSYHNSENITATDTDLYYALTRKCAVRAYGNNYKFDYYNDWNKAIDEMYTYFQSFNTPTGCKLYIINQNSSSQTIAYLVRSTVTIKLKKSSTLYGITTNNSCYSLEGAQYGLYADSACTKYVAGFILNANGEATLTNVTPGVYCLKEIKAPKGYALNTQKYTVNATADVTVNVQDLAQADPVNIVVEKKGGNGEPLAKAEFTVKYYDGYYDSVEAIGNKTPTKTWNLITDNDGFAALDNGHYLGGDLYYVVNGRPSIPLGTVTIQETKAPEGYILDDTIHLRQITSKGTDNFVETYNAPTATNVATEAHFNKVDEKGNPVSGAELAIMDGDNVVTSWVTDGTEHTVHGLAIDKEYTLVETKAPAGYQLADPVKFKGNVSVDVKMTNKPTEVYISKTDITGDKELPGAKLTVKDKDGKVVDTWTSTDKQHVIKGLTQNEKYTLVEEIAPKGYSKATEIEFTVKEKGVTSVQMKDKLTQTIISKTDITGEKELPGATLTVTDKEGNVIEEWVSEEKPHLIEGLTGGETYVLTEKIAPFGFAIANSIEFTVNESEDTIVNMKDDVTKTEISKKGITGDDELPGAKLTVKDKDGNVIDTWTSTTEPHYIEGLVGGEEYTLVEEIAPDGYVVANDIKFTVNTDGTTTKVEMKDDVTRFEFTKVDEDNKPVKGAKLQILDEDKKVVEEWVTDGTPHVVEGKLVVGKKYTLHEVDAPEGYEKAEDYTFEVKNTAELQKVVMVDKYNGEVTVSTPDQAVTPSNGQSGNFAAIQTGQSIPLTLIAVMFLVSAFAMMIFYRKRKEE